MDPALFEVTVQDGIVTVAGRPETVEDGKYLIEAVRRLDGVVAVRGPAELSQVTGSAALSHRENRISPDPSSRADPALSGAASGVSLSGRRRAGADGCDNGTGSGRIACARS
jgi:hypothetical protein